MELVDSRLKALGAVLQLPIIRSLCVIRKVIANKSQGAMKVHRALDP